ncbi:MAG: amidohydrolase family protein [Lachnospiraceae bacterium]
MLIKNGNLHIGDGHVLSKTDIQIKDKKIFAIGQNLSQQENEELIDASGKEVFPGFIDPLCAIGAMGIPTRYMDNAEASNPVMPEMNLRYSVDPDELSAQEFYKSGITTVGLAPNNETVFGGQIAVFKTPPMNYAERMVKEKVALKCSVTSAVKERFGEKNILPMTKMGIFYLWEKMFASLEHKKEESYDPKEKAVKAALDGELPFLVAAESQMEIQAILHFFKEKKQRITITDGYEFHTCIKEMLENKTNLILGNLSYLSQKTKHNMDLRALQALIDNGNLVAFTNTCGGYSEGREVLLWNAIDVYRAGIDPEEIIRMMTLNPAEILGIENRIGSIEEGKDADLSIYSAHPVTSYQARVETSIVNGEVVYRG